MLFALLTLLLPYWATPDELEFHIQFVLSAYEGYYEQFAATGLRDRAALTLLQKRTNYSMSILFWYRPALWRSVRRFHKTLLRVKKSLVPLEDVPEFSVIYKQE